MPMTSSVANPSTNAWYYYNPNWGTGRTSTWTDAHQFRYYWADVNGVGSKKANAFTKFTASQFNDGIIWMQIYRYLEPGDIIQYVTPSNGNTYHSQAVHRTSYENEEFKVSVGQHTYNDFYNLRSRVQALPSDTVVCIIKIKRPSTSYSTLVRSNMESNSLVSSTSDLRNLDDELYNSKPLTAKDEEEKWEEIASIKDEIIKRVQSENIRHKNAVTKDALIDFINNRMEYNKEVIASNTYDVKGIAKTDEATQLLVQNCKEENGVISSFLARVSDIDNQDITQIHKLWNEYWNNIIKQEQPSDYSCDIIATK